MGLLFGKLWSLFGNEGMYLETKFTLLSQKMLLWRRCTIDAAGWNIPGVWSMTQIYSIDDDSDIS